MSDDFKFQKAELSPNWTPRRKLEESIAYLTSIRNEKSPEILDWIIEQLNENLNDEE